MRKKLAIFGFGGHARSVGDLALACGYQDLLFIEASAQPGENFLGHVVVRNVDGFPGQRLHAFAASGDSKTRLAQCSEIATLGWELVTLVSPSATVGVGSSIDPGSFIGHHAHVGPMAKIGRGCIVNTGALVEHEAIVGDYAHISVNSTVAGRSRVGCHSMVGAGAVVIDRIVVGDGITIGAGSVVVRNVDEAGVYVGAPAKRIK